MATTTRPAAERHAGIAELLGASRRERDGLTRRVCELEAVAHAARVAGDFTAADQAADEADTLRAELTRSSSRVEALEAAERDISRERQRDEWSARLAEAEARMAEHRGAAQQAAAEFRPALSAAKLAARTAEYHDAELHEAWRTVQEMRRALGMDPLPGGRVQGPAEVAAGPDRYWLMIKNDGSL